MTIFKALFALLFLFSAPSSAFLSEDFLFPPLTESRPTLVIGIDDSISASVDLKDGELSLAVQKNMTLKGVEITPILYTNKDVGPSIFSSNARGHLFLPYTGEMFLLLWSWGWDIVSFSSGIADRSEKVIPPFIMTTLAKYYKDPEAIWKRLVDAKRMRIFSREHMKEERHGTYKKDLTVVGDLQDTLLAGDDSSYVVSEQMPYIGLDSHAADRLARLMQGLWGTSDCRTKDHAARNAPYLVGLLHKARDHMTTHQTRLREAVGASLKTVHNKLPKTPQENKDGLELSQAGERLIEGLVQERLTPPAPSPLATRILSVLPEPAAPYLALNLWEQTRMAHRLQPTKSLEGKQEELIEAMRIFSHPHMQGEDYLGILDILLGMKPERIRSFSMTFDIYRDAFYFPGLEREMRNNGYFLSLFETLAPFSSNKIMTIARRHRTFFPNDMCLFSRIMVMKEALASRKSKDIRAFSRVLQNSMPAICPPQLGGYDVGNIICKLAPLREKQVQAIAKCSTDLFKGTENSERSYIIEALGKNSPDGIKELADSLKGRYAAGKLVEGLNTHDRSLMVRAIAPLSRYQIIYIFQAKNDLFTERTSGWQRKDLIEAMGDFTPQRFTFFKTCVKTLFRNENDAERDDITKAFFELSDDQMKAVSENANRLLPPELHRHNVSNSRFLQNIKVLTPAQITAFAKAPFFDHIEYMEVDQWVKMPEILKDLTPVEIDQLKILFETPGPLRDQFMKENRCYGRVNLIQEQAKKIIAARGVKAE